MTISLAPHARHLMHLVATGASIVSLIACATQTAPAGDAPVVGQPTAPRLVTSVPVLLPGPRLQRSDSCRGARFFDEAHLYLVLPSDFVASGSGSAWQLEITLEDKHDTPPEIRLGEPGDRVLLEVSPGSSPAVLRAPFPSSMDLGSSFGVLRMTRRRFGTGRSDCLTSARVVRGALSIGLELRPGAEMAAAHARFGASGNGPLKRSGTLLLGASSFEPRCRAARCSMTVDNLSTLAAEVTIADQQTTLPGNGAITLTVDRGAEIAVAFSQADDAVDAGQPEMVLLGRPVPQAMPSADEAPSTIVLVTLDTTRRDVLGLYGGPAATPHLEEFSRQADTYTNAWATAPWTLPSHSSLFTGVYPSRHRAGTYEGFLETSWSFVEALANIGYFNLGLIGGPLVASQFGTARSFHEFHEPERWERSGRDLLNVLEGRLPELDGQPLFLFVNLFEPHYPYEAPPKFQRPYRTSEALEQVTDPRILRMAEGDFGVWGNVILDPPDDQGSFEFLRRQYLAEVTFVDQLFGRLISDLKGAGRWDDALIIVTADHGELLGEFGLVSHSGVLYAPLTAVPLLVKLPGQNEGRRVETLVSQVDVAPTIGEVLGLTTPPIDGVSLLNAGGLQARRFVVSEEHSHWVHPLRPELSHSPHAFVLQRSEQREILWNGGGHCERLVSGEWEQEDCIDAAQRLAGVVGLLDSDLSPTDDSSSMPAEQEEMLRRLGYIQ